MFIYPYKAGSQSVAALKEALEARVIRRENSRFTGKKSKLVINWGASSMSEEVLNATIINDPEAVAIASNKLSFFEAVKSVVNIPEYTKDKDEAFGWLEKGKIVLARTKLSGNSGEGITVIQDEAAWNSYWHPDVQLYVKYIPKKDEYRIHVGSGKVIDMQRKAKRHDEGSPNWHVRSYNNGFNFVREGVDPPKEVIEQAILAVTTIGLDFGAVDVIWNEFYQKAYVLEVNTAPGLEGTTVEKYKEYFDSLEKGSVEADLMESIRQATTAYRRRQNLFETPLELRVNGAYINEVEPINPEDWFEPEKEF